MGRSKGQQLLKERITDGLKVKNSRIYKFYTSPKIHKQGMPQDHS